MICEIISIGEELLSGNTLNTNATFLAKRLTSLGYSVQNMHVVGDHPDRLKELLKTVYERADVIITTGGMGPTYDDLSKEAVCEFLNIPLFEDEETASIIRNYFTERGREMPMSNLKQALIPQGAVIIHNQNGTAPGIVIECEDDKAIVMLPGPPREVIAMTDNFLMDYFAKKADEFIIIRDLNCSGYGESTIFEYIEEYALSVNNPNIATYVGSFEIAVRLSAHAKSKDEAEHLLDEAEKNIRALLPEDCIYGVNQKQIEYALIALLKEKKLKIATAESCTGGLLSKRITDVEGASEVFDCGICSYSNSIKHSLLGVNAYEAHGAVSEETAKEMAQGIYELSGADIGISITGIAGPGGGSVEKPVGLVYIGIKSALGLSSYKFEFTGSINNGRDIVRSRTATTALRLALEEARHLKAK